MSDLANLLNVLYEDGTIQRIARNPAAQFGLAARPYLGATLLPERPVPDNAFREDNIRYRTVIANHGARYSPSQKKGGALVGSFLVELGEQDIAAEFTSRDYDALIRHLQTNNTMDAVASVVNFVDVMINRALLERNEKDRWDAIVDASVVRTGDNNYSETVAYPDPSGHRAAAAAAWSTDTTDIFEEIFTYADLLASKGYTVNRCITSRAVLSIMAGNDTVKTRTGIAVVNPSGQITSAAGRATWDAINGIMQRDGLPPVEVYDLQYRTATGTSYFLDQASFVLVATTGRDEAIDFGDTIEIVPETLGYFAIGRPAGQSGPGRVIRAESFTNKPPRIEAEGWQTSLPVITEPEAIAVIHTIT